MGNSVILLCFIVKLFNICFSCVINDINTEIISNEDISNAVDLARNGLIFPGTKWCGAGDVADNYDDLGCEKEADMCCRDHDNCPDFIAGGETKFNLTNKTNYTRLSCACDESFYNCLKTANTRTAKVIGSLYFDALALQTQCFRKDYPVLCCMHRGGLLKPKCVEYSYDKCGEKVYQWFDVQDFTYS